MKPSELKMWPGGLGDRKKPIGITFEEGGGMEDNHEEEEVKTLGESLRASDVQEKTDERRKHAVHLKRWGERVLNRRAESQAF